MKNVFLLSFFSILVVSGCIGSSKSQVESYDVMTSTTERMTSTTQMKTTASSPMKPVPTTTLMMTGTDAASTTTMKQTTTTLKSGISLSQVEMHDSKDSCWVAVDGKVYDISRFDGEHKGGSVNILKLCGTDGSRLFNKKHGSYQKAKDTLAGFYLDELS